VIENTFRSKKFLFGKEIHKKWKEGGVEGLFVDVVGLAMVGKDIL
jgi:hypothetical protein